MLARSIKWKTEDKINCLPWQSESPDISLIENVMRIIKICLRVQHDIKTRQGFIDKVQEIWMSLKPGFLKAMYLTPPMKIQVIIKAKCYATKF